MSAGPIVVKVGGSLFDMPDLAQRLRAWLTAQAGSRILLVPGGGAAADVVRDFDKCHSLGEEASHWLALRALRLNAELLAVLLKDVAAEVVEDLGQCPMLWERSILPVADVYAFARADEGRPGCLPHRWSVTSDSLAARIAKSCRASQLILLKSVTMPEGVDWNEGARAGWVDDFFAQIATEAPRIRAINFRQSP